MNEHTTNPRIIIDKSYIQGMHRDGAPFRYMCEQGGRIVLIDTLAYELCSTANSAQWPASKCKLTACSDAIEVWAHVSEMLKVEIEQNRPYGGPLHDERTKRMRQMIADNPEWEPVDLKAIIEHESQKREGKGILEQWKAFTDCEILDQEIAKEIKNKPGNDKEVVQICYNIVNDPDKIRLAMKEFVTNPNDVDKTWAIWHFCKSLLAMSCDRQRRDSPFEKGLANTKHDLDYLVSLAFADAIASGETQGEMSYYRQWMFGDDSKTIIFSYEKDQIDSVMDRLKYGSTGRIPDDEVRNPPVRPISRLFGALQHDGPTVTVEEMEQAIADGACEE